MNGINWSRYGQLITNAKLSWVVCKHGRPAKKASCHIGKQVLMEEAPICISRSIGACSSSLMKVMIKCLLKKKKIIVFEGILIDYRVRN
jgi:hypothetical protein